MLYGLIWFLAATLFAFWSLAAWALHALAGWMAAGAGGLASVPGKVSAIPLPEWLVQWLPPGAAESIGALLSTLKPMIESALAFAPSAIGWVSPVVWVLWAIGSVVLLCLALAITLLVKNWQGRALAVA